MTTVAFIGLGIMGAPMARNLLTFGHRVIAVNRSPGKIDAFVAAGGQGATTVSEAVAQADVVFTMLPDSPDVEAVALGPEGVFAHARPGTLLVDGSTISPQTARHIAAVGAAHGTRVVDAPVSGGEQGAIEGSLSVMAGGEASDFEAARPFLEVVGSTVVHVGPPGAGQTVKAANQLIVAGIIELVSEALVFLDKHDVDLMSAVRVLAGGLAGNRVLDRKAESMVAHRFEPGFRIDLHHKDLGIVLEAARESGSVIPLGSLVAQLMASARERDHGSLDHSALLLGVENLSGHVIAR
ncbi:2-hydroxy-3-oxopropionate reductase [Microbacterium sp. STN6]|uniref:2-hydroxy-3-oxopropionate reductase n=1 Tax=Microbacterium sp. STN6 TaxID=2995588 RepID=UPI002260C930|nr:2-hydroxy-3-oxopropionate reductase [Microbacterium sp. STN6]MCX7522507.1 2-hydroxy-3-oxopropionate reductase [Microbacterium sp. STN6]